MQRKESVGIYANTRWTYEHGKGLQKQEILVGKVIYVIGTHIQ
jgi:hypothetical protein